MRYAMIALLLTGGCASKMETAWQTVHLVDGLQTLAIARDDCYEEQDPLTRGLIGRRPSEGEAVAWWAGSAVFHAWVSRRLESRPRWQAAWQAVTFVYAADAVVQNHQAGLRPIGGNRVEDSGGWCAH